MLDYLRSLGVVTASFQWIRPTADQVAALYADNRATRRAGPAERDRLVDELFTSDWCLACFLRAPALPPGRLWDLLAVLKGPADPGGLKPGHLRSVLGAENTVMNGVHVGDSPEESRREARALLLDDLALPGADGVGEPIDLDGRTSSSALYVGYRLRRRLIRRYVDQPSQALIEQLAAEKAMTADPQKPPGVLGSLRALRAQQAVELNAARVEPPVARLLDDLGKVCSTSYDLTPLEPRLRQEGVTATAWDRLILRCQQDQGVLPHW